MAKREAETDAIKAAKGTVEKEAKEVIEKVIEETVEEAVGKVVKAAVAQVAITVTKNVETATKNAKIATVEANKAAAEAKNNSVLGVLTNNVQKEVEPARIFVGTDKTGASPEQNCLYIKFGLGEKNDTRPNVNLHVLSPDSDKLIIIAEQPIKFKNGSYAFKLESVGDKTGLASMKTELGMSSDVLQVKVSSKTRDALKDIVQSYMTETLPEEVVTKILGAPAEVFKKLCQTAFLAQLNF